MRKKIMVSAACMDADAGLAILNEAPLGDLLRGGLGQVADARGHVLAHAPHAKAFAPLLPPVPAPFPCTTIRMSRAAPATGRLSPLCNAPCSPLHTAQLLLEGLLTGVLLTGS